MELNLLCQSFDTITLIFGKWNHDFYTCSQFLVLMELGKLSVIFLILRLMGNISRWRKWMLYSVAIFFPIVAVLNVILTFVQCNPPHALWEPQTKDVKCWNPNVQIDFLVVASGKHFDQVVLVRQANQVLGYSALSDYFLALVPATFIWHLQMSLQKKITLCILLGLGLVGGTAAIVKTIQIRDLIQREDITWFAFTVYIWASIEVFLNIICGSIPTLSPLYDKCIKGKPLRPSNARAYHTRISSQPAAEFTWSPHLPSGMEQTHFTDSSQRSIWRHGTSDEDSIGIAQTITTSLEAK